MAISKDEWSAIVETNYRALYLFALRLLGRPSEAEDAVQDAFLKAFSALRPEWDKASLRPLLFTITRNCCLDRRRWWRRWTAFLASIPTSEKSVAPPSVPELDFLDKLPQKQREVLVLRHFQGMSTQETAKLLGISEGTVKSQLSKAIAAARSELLK